MLCRSSVSEFRRSAPDSDSFPDSDHWLRIVYRSTSSSVFTCSGHCLLAVSSSFSASDASDTPSIGAISSR
jgi:hypothetical protein